MTMVSARSGSPVRFLVTAQFCYAAWFATCVYLALARAAELTGHWYVPSMGDAFTANADIMAGRSLGSLVALTVSTAAMVAGLALMCRSFCYCSDTPAVVAG